MALLVTTLGTTTLHADTLDRVSPSMVASSGAEPDPTVKVMNNHGRQVSVYVVDADNRHHLLGRVDAARSVDLQIPTGLTQGMATVHFKIYPVGEDVGVGLGVTVSEPDGVKTRGLTIRTNQLVVLYLDPDLTRSRVGIASS